VLLVRLSALGDCVHTIPVAWALRQALPEVSLGWAIQPGPHQLLAGLACVDRFHVVPRRGSWRERWAALAEIRSRRYEVVLDLQGLAKSAVITLASGARRRLGWAGPESREGNRLVLTERLEIDPRVTHVVDRNLALLRLLGIDDPQVRWDLPSPGVAEPGLEVLVWPGTTWVTKIWPERHWAELVHTLVDSGQRVVVGWGNEQERDVALRVAGTSGATVLPPTSLPELSALLARARLVVAGDTGPLHLAVAHGTPTVAIFGATDPARTGPYGGAAAGHVVVVREGLQCRPCGARQCHRGDLACLEGLEVARVLAACRRQLAGDHSGAG
jgi:heptosyltransferase-1